MIIELYSSSPTNLLKHTHLETDPPKHTRTPKKQAVTIKACPVFKPKEAKEVRGH